MWEISKILLSGVVALCAVYIGARLADRNHRRDWIADSKMEEYRELITTMTKSMSTLYSMSVRAVLYSDMQRERGKAYTDVLEVHGSRVFIANRIKSLCIGEQWKSLNDALWRSHKSEIFVQNVQLLIAQVVKLAHEDAIPENSDKLFPWLGF
jgi:hypothetical protein